MRFCPNYFMIELTNHCQLKCATCTQRYSGRVLGYTDMKTVDAFIKSLAGFGRQTARVALNGHGEPLIHPEFGTVISMLSEAGFTGVDIITNGIALDDKNIAIIMGSACCASVRISLNSTDPITHEAINIGSRFGRVIGNIRNLIKNKSPNKKVYIQVVKNYDPSATREKIAQLVDGEDFEMQEKVFHNMHGMIPMSASDKLVRAGIDCTDYFQHGAFVHWNGDIVGCCFDVTKEQVCGTIYEGIFSDAVQNRIQAFREKRPPFCMRCLKDCGFLK